MIQRANKYFRDLWPWLIVLVCGFLYGRYLPHPTFFIDESYYIFAARKILSGDFFLRTFAFDKPILQALMPIPGMLIAGETPIGFRLSGFLFWVLGIFVWFRFFVRVFSADLADKDDRGDSRAQQYDGPHKNYKVPKDRFGFLAALWTMAVALNPFLATYSVSPMAEAGFFVLVPLLGLEILKWRLNPEGDRGRGALFLALGLLLKQTFILWAPLYLIGYPMRQWRAGILRFIQRTWGLFLIGGIWFLTGPVKLAPISMAVGGLGHASQKASILESLTFWFQQIAFAGAGIGILVLIAAIWTLVKAERLGDRQLAWIVLGHFCFFIVMRVNHFERYMVLFYLGAFLLAGIWVSQMPTVWARILSGLVILPVFFLKPALLTPEAGPGRELWALKDQVPARALIHSPNAWILFQSLQPQQEQISCVEEFCIKEARHGRELMKDQWIVRADSKDSIASIERTDFLLDENKSEGPLGSVGSGAVGSVGAAATNGAGRSCADQRRSVQQADKVVRVPATEWQKSFFEAIRVEGAVKKAVFRKELIQFELKNPLLGRSLVRMSGKWVLGFSNFDERGDRVVEPRFKVEGLMLEDFDLTDLAFSIWGFSAIPVSRLRVSEGPWERIEDYQMADEQGESWGIRLMLCCNQ